jgi:hypothetical protein
MALTLYAEKVRFISSLAVVRDVPPFELARAILVVARDGEDANTNSLGIESGELRRHAFAVAAPAREGEENHASWDLIDAGSLPCILQEALSSYALAHA